MRGCLRVYDGIPAGAAECRRDLAVDSRGDHTGRLVELVGEGLTNRQIAARLGLAEKTVKNYVSTMLGKLGVESRTQAAIVALKRTPR